MIDLPMQSVHPLLVHFPIGLLISSWVLALVGWVLKRPIIRQVALWNLGLGVIAAGGAIWSGLLAENVARHTFESHQVMMLHKKLGIIVGCGAAALFLWQLLRPSPHTAERVVIFFLMTALVGALSVGAHLGGRLVYEFGVGGTFGQSQNVIRGIDHDRPKAPSHDHSHDH